MSRMVPVIKREFTEAVGGAAEGSRRPPAAGVTALPEPGGEALVDGSALTINNVNIIRTDIRTDDGIIHVLDEVLEPGADVVPPDAGAPDSGMPDSDSGTPDAGAPDASAADAGQ